MSPDGSLPPDNLVNDDDTIIDLIRSGAETESAPIWEISPEGNVVNGKCFEVDNGEVEQIIQRFKKTATTKNNFRGLRK